MGGRLERSTRTMKLNQNLPENYSLHCAIGSRIFCTRQNPQIRNPPKNEENEYNVKKKKKKLKNIIHPLQTGEVGFRKVYASSNINWSAPPSDSHIVPPADARWLAVP